MLGSQRLRGKTSTPAPRERARVRSEKGIRWGGRPLTHPT
jgi:hypothetical protein